MEPGGARNEGLSPTAQIFWKINWHYYSATEQTNPQRTSIHPSKKDLDTRTKPSEESKKVRVHYQQMEAIQVPDGSPHAGPAVRRRTTRRSERRGRLWVERGVEDAHPAESARGVWVWAVERTEGGEERERGGKEAAFGPLGGPHELKAQRTDRWCPASLTS
jgi:hypothetical protein